jgi:hypothetical protein
MYRVIKFFTDLQDNNHAYKVGDVFPHDGMKVSEMRLKELSTDANRRHLPLIEKVEDEVAEAENVAEDTTQEPVEGSMNPPEEADETPEEEPVEDSEDKEDAPKPKKKRGRPRNDAE